MISEKQRKILAFPYTKYDGLICDGSVRCGKTSLMTVAFVDWAMREFDGHNFALCSKTLASCLRNVVRPYMELTYVKKRYVIKLKMSGTDNYCEIYCPTTKRRNTFYLFGGKDEQSYALIQGITLAGVLLDEAALMPESFINQAIVRCSVDGSKYWLNCNPDGSPEHYFYKEWIAKAKEKNLLYLHFTMDDNPGLSEGTRRRYENLYKTGVFHQRYILGLWVQAEGAIYPMFDRKVHVVSKLPKMLTHWVSVDYGHTNSTVFLLFGYGVDGKLYLMAEDIHDAKVEGDRSPQQYSLDLQKFLTAQARIHNGLNLDSVIVDPAAKGFIVQLREDNVARIKHAYNDVQEGIELTSSMLTSGLLRIHESCKVAIGEMMGYVWNPKRQVVGVDEPLKVRDHCPDAIRYMVMYDRTEWRRRVANAA